MFDDLEQMLAQGNGRPQPVQNSTATPAKPTTEPDPATPQDIVVTGVRPKAPTQTQISAPGPKQAMDPKNDIFASLPGIIDGQVSDVRNKGQQLGDVFDTVSAGLKEDQAKKTDILTTAVAAKKSINDQVLATNNEILAEVTPLFAEKQALADRRGELKDMNPIKKALFGIFDRNYSDSNLASREAIVNDQLASRGEEFSQMNALTNQLLSATSNTAQDAVSLVDLHGENLNQDMQLATTALGLARGSLADSIQGVSAKTEVTRAQMLLADKTLSDLDGKNLSAAIAAAQKNGGRVVVNGAELSSAQLKERADNLQKQELGLIAAKQSVVSGGLQIQSQRMSIARQAEQLTIDHMSYSDAQAAVQAGGMYKGHQLDLGAIGTHLAEISRGLDASVEVSQGANLVRATGQVAQQLGYQSSDYLRRGAQIFGRNPPPEFLQWNQRVAAKLAETQATIHNANGPTAAKQIGAMIPGIQAMMSEGDKLIDRIAGRMSGDKDVQLAIGAGLKGTPLSADQAVRSSIAMMKGGGMPAGMKLGGPAAAAFRMGQQAMQSVIQSPNYLHADKEGKEIIMRQVVGEAIRKNWTNGVVKNVTAQMPDMARALGDPFGSKLTRDQFLATQHAGDEQGKAALVRDFNSTYGVNFDQAKMDALFRHDPQAVAEAKKGGKFDGTAAQVAALSQKLQSYQTSAWMQNMDQVGGNGTSRAFANFMNRGDVQSKIGSYADGLGQRGLGELVADSTNPGGVRGSFANAADFIHQVVTANQAAQIASTRASIAAYSNDPVTRAGVVLANIDGLSQHDRIIAQGVIKQAVNGSGIGQSQDGGTGYFDENTPVTRTGDAANAAMEQAIKNTSYRDPGLRRIMSHVAKNWDVAAGGADRAMSHLATGEHK